MELPPSTSPTSLNHNHTATVAPKSMQHTLPTSAASTVAPITAAQHATDSVPPGLATACENGDWQPKNVYMWDLVVDVARAGHALGKKAEDELAHLSHRSDAPHAAQPRNERVHVDDEMRRQIRDVLAARGAKRIAQRRALVREYKRNQHVWLRQLQQHELEQSGSRREFDAQLLLATRSRYRGNSGAANRDAAQVFADIERAGGTAGGLERWSKSITKVPEQNSEVVPVDGGILIEDPMREHYNARMVSPWTQPERLVFLEKFVAHGKDFRKIAAFLPHKTVHQCVQFYYNNKLALDLKTLGKCMPAKRRASSRHVLLELSKKNPVKRSMAANFTLGKRREREPSPTRRRTNKRLKYMKTE